MNINTYKISPTPFNEINAIIVNTSNNKAIATDNKAIHTFHDLDKPFPSKSSTTTLREFLDLNTPIESNINLGSWVRTFGVRIERN